MSTNPPVYIILTTYKREDCAVKTIQALKKNLIYDNLGWFVVDDGSPEGYLERLLDEIGPSNGKFSYNSNRRGVGHGMNTALRSLWDMGVELILMMEDDWELENPLHLDAYVKTLMDYPENGMIRFGYLSYDLLGYSVSYEGELYWRLENNGTTYRFTGHPSLRHKRFHDKNLGGCGLYEEGLTPGMTELSMCGKSNTRTNSNILYPARCGLWGFFAHIGAEHLGNVEPEVK